MYRIAKVFVLMATFVLFPIAAKAALVTVSFSGDTQTITESLNIGDKVTIFGDTGGVAQDFSHTLEFTVNAPGSASASATFNILDDIFNFSAFQYALYKQGDVPTYVNAGQKVSLASIAFGETYILNIKGTSSGTDGGNYTGNLTTVPLPAAIVLFGSALVGLGVTRRRKSEVAVVTV